MSDDRLDLKKVINQLIKDKFKMIELNKQKDLIIQDLQTKLNNYERSNVKC